MRAEREVLIADATIEVLARDGARGLTHRAVDKELSLPEGTTSFYFRTRQALLEAAARRVFAVFLEDRATILRESAGFDGIEGAVTALIRRGEGRSRSQFVARFELGLEAARSEAIADVLNQLRAESVKAMNELLLDGDPSIDAETVQLLTSMIIGVLFERLTLGAPSLSPERLARLLVKALPFARAEAP
jgi:DNA-binding transcriptional regulator YbjK